MARIKPKRHSVIVDMTPFVDVAFLILTFFILTAQFRPSEVAEIETPFSISTSKLEATNLMTVSITPDGRFFFLPIESGAGKAELLDKMAAKYKINFTEGEKNAFIVGSGVPVSITQLKQYLHLSKAERKQVKKPGIPLNEDNKELMDWIKFSLEVNPYARLAIKGDAKAQYPKFKELFEDLRDIDFYKFVLITSSTK